MPHPGPIPAPAHFATAEQAMEVAREFDLKRIGPEFIANPYPTYGALRAHNPVARMPDGSYFLSGYADCLAVYKDAKLFSSDKKAEFLPKFGSGLLYEHHTTSLIFNDPPLHTRVRKIMAGALNARAVADMEAPMVALTDRLLDTIAARGEADLIADLAAAVPIEVIGNGLYALLEWPGEKARLLADPNLIHSAVEEFLRFESPVQIGNRLVTTDTVVGGVPMSAGTFVTIGIAAANRDPTEFSDPDRLDIGRPGNRHVAFASGVHFCVGLNIARMEGRIAIGRFLSRFPNYRLKTSPTRGGRARFRGFLTIPVSVG